MAVLHGSVVTNTSTTKMCLASAGRLCIIVYHSWRAGITDFHVSDPEMWPSSVSFR